MSNTPIVALVGPTASGKSALGLSIAEVFGAEIISVDSAAIYRDMEKGTAKPTAEDRRRVPHHLIDILSPLERYSVERFTADVLSLIDEIEARGKRVLLLGGTLMYFNALVKGLDDLPGADEEIREALNREALVQGWPSMHAQLSALDPITASRLKPQDSQRIQRALEVIRISGRPLSSFHGQSARPPLADRIRKVALMPEDRAPLHARIRERFEAMLDAGLVDEVRSLIERYPDLHPGLPAMRSVGYRQAWQYLVGELSERDLIEKGVVATRQLAKRQMTWIRGMEIDRCFDPFAPSLQKDVLDAIEEWWPRVAV